MLLFRVQWEETNRLLGPLRASGRVPWLAAQATRSTNIVDTGRCTPAWRRL